MIIIDLSAPYMNPIYLDPIRNIVPNLVYAARGTEVETVIIDGKIIVDHHTLMTVDEGAVIEKANAGARRISNKLKADPRTAGLPLARWTAEKYY